ncbi:MAG TPA: cyclic nucleotide-binding domain-containing protein [Desulfobacteraceae bacterium]|nr:cyclic nucleotide-binding domain-containing protein [Desulfobacteraceae bacterium]
MNSSTNNKHRHNGEGSSIDRKTAFLQQLPFFHETALETLRLYAYLANIEKFPANEPITVQGEPADRMYLIVSGRIGICAEHRGRQFHLQLLSADGFNYFGELALLAEFDWLFSAFALTDVTALTITREAFHKVMEKYPEQLPKTVSRIIKLRIERFVDQTHYLLDHLKEEAWRECGSEE